MKFNILFPIKEGPSGGGNQFLNALKNNLLKRGLYEEDYQKAEIVLFNSYPFDSAKDLYSKVISLKQRKSNIPILIHRVDGPISVVRGSLRSIDADKSILEFNSLMADATIFQSNWSRDLCYRFGLSRSKPSRVIMNAPSPVFFEYPEGTASADKARVRIIATSWSSNWRKGFDIYKFLDDNLDFNRFEMTFAGNSPVSFNNIKSIPALNPRELSEQLNKHDIYITASVDDPCSNALIEALNCGLPAVVRRSGGHPEIVNESGVLFDNHSDVIFAIEECIRGYDVYKSKIEPKSIDAVALQYIEFAKALQKTRSYYPVSLEKSSVRRLISSVNREKYRASLIKKCCHRFPINEAIFYKDSVKFRRFIHDSDSKGTNWGEENAFRWTDSVISRLPMFLDSMRHTIDNRLYKYSMSGDIQELPSLSASVFAAKIRYMINSLAKDDVAALQGHILSFQGDDGSIADPWIKKHSHLRRGWGSFRSRNFNNFFNHETVRAETRQAFAALRCLGAKAKQQFLDVPTIESDIERYISSLNWSAPWSSGSHISHLAFFLKYHQDWFNDRNAMTAKDVLDFVEVHYRNDDGAWYKPGAEPSIEQKINGAMKMVTAYDAADISNISDADKLIDLCLSAVNEGHACNHFNVICVLHRASGLTHHRKEEVKKYCLERLKKYDRHYWSYQGGFSFFPDGANSVYYNARVSSGMAEPDIHGTVLMLWGIVLISDIFNWSDTLNIKKPYT